MSNVMPPGWYHAEGDPPGTHRYWNGGNWEGGPQPIPQAPGQVGQAREHGQAAPYAQYAQQYPESSNSVAALVVGIVGLVACCGLINPIAWYLGSEELKAIDAGRRDPAGRSNANAGRILGIIGSVIVIGVVLFYLVAFIVSLAAAERS